MIATLILGLLGGLTTGLLAVGIVLVYRANRFVNLAHAQLGALSALVLAKLVLDDGWNWWAAVPVAVALGSLTGMLVEVAVIRPMRARNRRGVSFLLVSTGVAQLLLALTYVPRLAPDNTTLFRNGYPVPFDVRIEIGQYLLRAQHLLILIVVPSLVVGLWAFLKLSSLGKQIRAAASNPDAARLCGVAVARVSATTWAIAGAFSAVSAVLQAPSQGSFNAAALGPELLLRALGAAAFGGFSSVAGAMVGGIVIGEAEQIALNATHHSSTAELVVFLVVLAILVGRGRLISGASGLDDTVVEDPPRPRRPASVQARAIVRFERLWLAVGGLILGVVLPGLPYFRHPGNRFQLVLIMVFAIAGVALTMLVGWAGQVSLGHFALLGIGAYLAARLEPHGFSLPLLLVLAGGAGALVMVVVGLPALRLRGLTLAVTTLGLAVLGPNWLFVQPWLGGRGQSAVTVAPSGLPGVGRMSSLIAIYYVALALLAILLATGSALRRSSPGRLVLAVRDNEPAVASLGVTPSTVKLAILATSGFFVAAAGVLWGTAWHSISPDLLGPQQSLVLLAVPVIGGLGSPAGAVAGAFFVYLPGLILAPLLMHVFGSFGHQIGFQLALGGGGLVAASLAYPAGLAGVARGGWQRFVDVLDRALAARDEPPEVPLPLEVVGVSVAFGGVHALDDVSIEVRPGEIVGLIGPNGAGKTTLINVISGQVAPAAGSVRVTGREVSDLTPEYRAHFGLGRSFQSADLFPGLTVRETIQLAGARTQRIGFLSAMLAVPWARATERQSRANADQVITRLGLDDWADALVAELSTGTKRICDLALQVAAEPRVLLLDEPTAGMAQREVEALGPLLRRIRDDLDCSLLVVEHDMPLLMGLCDRIYAMEAGAVIAEGTPEEIRHDPIVIASYLGTDTTAIERSGARRDPSAPTAAAGARRKVRAARLRT